MNGFSIEIMGPEYVLMMVVFWAAAMLVALAGAWLRRLVNRRNRLGYIELHDPATRRAS